MLHIYSHAGNFGVLWYQYRSLSHLSSSRTLPPPPPPPPPPPMTLAPSPSNSSRNTLEISDDEIDDLYNDISINGGYIPQHTPFTTSTLTNEFPLNSPVKCAANTRSGLPCRLYANPGSKFCHRHK